MLPIDFVNRMKDMLGEEYPAFEAGFEKPRFHALRFNPLKGEKADFLEKARFTMKPVPWEENGYYYQAEDTPGKHPFHEAGVYYIQEPSAMAPVPFLEVKPGERVLDLCAAPGGKSTQIAAALAGKGLLVCNEIHPARAKILSENVERMGIRNAIVTNETPEKLAEVFVGYFDKILVDAPCSGEGMFRKNEEAPEQWSLQNVELCGERQDGILDCADKMLRPGGRLVYSTCTFAPIENEGSISRFLQRHGDYSIVPATMPETFSPGRAAWCDFPVEGIEHTMRIWPHMTDGEGHYLAILQKSGEADGEVRSLYGLEKSVNVKELTEYREFAGECLKTELKGVYIKYGDQLYLGPENMPSLYRLKVLRPGLHLGTMKKNRFEPSHALALALTKEDVKNSYDLSAEDGSAQRYLGGQTFHIEQGKGWHLICVEGYSLGWGKAAGGIMKNHYPKGLRKL